MPLIIDAPDWGKDEKIIGRNWKELLNSYLINVSSILAAIDF